jgi:intein/homing endonuclease
MTDVHVASEPSISASQSIPEFKDALRRFHTIVNENPSISIAEVLPLIFKLKGFPFSLKDHFPQEPLYKLLRPPPRMVIKAGRQVAKCGSVNNKVVRANGSVVALKDAQVGDELISHGSDFKARRGKITAVYSTGLKPLLRIKTAWGSTFEVTPEHRLRTLLGFTAASKLTVGSRVAVSRRAAFFEGKHTDPARIKSLAYMLGDGCCGTGSNPSWNFTSATPESLTEMAEITGGTVKRCGKGLASSICLSRRSQVVAWIKLDDLAGKYSYEKWVPAWVFDLSEEQTALFLNRLWSTDGCIFAQNANISVSYTSTSERLARDVQNLLRKLGILSSVTRKKTYCNGKRHRDAFVLRLLGYDSIERFYRVIGPIYGKPALRSPATVRNNNRLTVPIEINQAIARLYNSVPVRHGHTLHHTGLRHTAKYALSERRAGEYVAFFETATAARPAIAGTDLELLRNAVGSDVHWDTIIAIEDIGAGETADVEVETSHTYVLDGGVVSHNSTNLAVVGLLRAMLCPHYSLLTVTPLFEQIRKFSSNYVKPMLAECTVKSHIIKPGQDNSVLQRTLANGATLHYNYASNSADRIRGTPADELATDECQDMDLDLLPVIEQCLAASPWAIRRYSGTPKTFDGPLQYYWDLSSQAIWHVPCLATGCKHLNRCSVDGDLIKMSWGTPGMICAKCGKLVDPRWGFYIHDFPDRQISFPGYHEPQVLFPMHYANPNKWADIQSAMKEKQKYIIYNEIYGESFDSGQKLVTREDLQAVAHLEVQTPRTFAAHKDIYLETAVGVDWGGKGREKTTDEEVMVSNTVFALGGMRTDGVIEIRYIKRTPYEAEPLAEAQMAKSVVADSNAFWFAHDFGGAGNLREAFMSQAGFPMKRIVPFTYQIMSLNKPIIFYQGKGPAGARTSYILDKSRSILLLCEMIKLRLVLLPDWGICQKELKDFLNIFEESMDGPRGSARQLVKRMRKTTDDTVNAVNYCVMALLHSTGKWPKIADAYNKPIEGDPEVWGKEDL